MSKAETLVQAAVVAGTEDLDMQVGGIYKLKARRLTDFEIAGAVEDTDYVLDRAAGLVQSLTLTGAKTCMYDAPAITSGHKSGIGNAPTLTASVLIRGTNDEGVKSLIQLWKVRFRPTGGRSLISEEEDAELQIEGDILPDETQPEAYKYGYEEDV